MPHPTRLLLILATLLGLLPGTRTVTAQDMPNPADAYTLTARGHVFDDRNGNGRRDADEPGIPEVGVSNGRDIVLTDADGAYELAVTDDTIIFVLKPRGWRTAVDPQLNLPRHYYLHKPSGSPKLRYPGVAPTGPLPAAVDFPLTRQEEPDRFRVILFGDPQPRNIQEIEFLAHDILEEVIGTDAAFAMTLGDIVFDRLDLFQPLNEYTARIGMPIYNVLGNHDLDFEAPHDKLSDETFELHYGPTYYSFDYGQVHFLVLDTVMWFGAVEGKRGYYRAGLGADQLAFIRNDLRRTPNDRLIVVTMHIPMLELPDEEKHELYGLLADFPHTVSWSAHHHVNQQWFLTEKDGWPGTEPHHHTTLVTGSGSWWAGPPDQYGIPHTQMRDGAPNGWTTVAFEGPRYVTRFKAARRPWSHQMHIWTAETIPHADLAAAEVLVNVFNGSPRTVVELRVKNGSWQRITQADREDPFYLALKAGEEQEPPLRGRKLPATVKCSHLWQGGLPATLEPGVHLVEVRATDMFGQQDVGRRLFRVEK